ncbi:MAG: antitoxin VapB family protein [Thermoplasmata archaeon]
MPNTKTISLDQQAYRILRLSKRKGESFSDVVKRLATKGKPLSKYAGSWKGMPDDLKEAIQRFRKDARRRDRQRSARVRGQ